MHDLFLEALCVDHALGGLHSLEAANKWNFFLWINWKNVLECLIRTTSMFSPVTCDALTIIFLHCHMLKCRCIYCVLWCVIANFNYLLPDFSLWNNVLDKLFNSNVIVQKSSFVVLEKMGWCHGDIKNDHNNYSNTWIICFITHANMLLIMQKAEKFGRN